MGVGGGWEAKGGLNHPLAAQRKSCCVFSKAQNQPQCSYMSGQDSHWEEFDTTCSLIIVHPSGTIHP